MCHVPVSFWHFGDGGGDSASRVLLPPLLNHLSKNAAPRSDHDDDRSDGVGGSTTVADDADLPTGDVD